MVRGAPPGALQHLPDAQASHRGPRLPGGPPRAMKWIIISEHWYYCPPPRLAHPLRIAAMQPFQQEGRQQGGQRDDDDHAGINFIGEYAGLALQFREDQPDLAARGHRHPDGDARMPALAQEQGADELARHGNDEHGAGKKPDIA